MACGLSCNGINKIVTCLDHYFGNKETYISQGLGFVLHNHVKWKVHIPLIKQPETRSTLARATCHSHDFTLVQLQEVLTGSLEQHSNEICAVHRFVSCAAHADNGVVVR